MFIDFLTPEIFDAIICLNVAAGLALAGRRFVMDLRHPLPEDAPAWARERFRAQASHSPSERS